jgi:hypothetical protein
MLSIFDDPVFDFSDLRVLMIKLVQFSIIMIPKIFCVACFRYLSWNLKSRHAEKTLKNSKNLKKLMIFKIVWFAEFVLVQDTPWLDHTLLLYMNFSYIYG